MSGQSVPMRVWLKVLDIVHNAAISAMSTVRNWVTLAATYMYKEYMCPLMNGAVTAAQHYTGEAIMVAGTLSAYDWVFYIICFNIGIWCFAIVAYMLNAMHEYFPIMRIAYNGLGGALKWVKNDMEGCMRGGLYGLYRMPTTMLVFLATAPFRAMLRVVDSVDGDTQPPSEHSVVYTMVSTKVYELAVITKRPYVLMYNTWFFIMIAVKLSVVVCFDYGVYVLQAIGKLIWDILVEWPACLFKFVASERQVLKTIGAYAGTINNWFNAKYTASRKVSLCFDCMHHAFLMSVHAWVVYSLYANWTTMTETVYSLNANWTAVTETVYSLNANWTAVTDTVHWFQGNQTVVTETVHWFEDNQTVVTDTV